MAGRPVGSEFGLAATITVLPLVRDSLCPRSSVKETLTAKVRPLSAGASV